MVLSFNIILINISFMISRFNTAYVRVMTTHNSNIIYLLFNITPFATYIFGITNSFYK